VKEKLLVLDDEALILTSLEHLLEDDYEVHATSDPQTALRLAQDHNIAVILCDERMPGVAGHEFLSSAREVSSATRVMMSGYADMNALTEAVNSGQIFAYIGKPWEPLKLKAQVAVAALHFKLVQEVEQERGLLRALMENIPDLIYFKDCESRFTRVNQAHARNLGAKDPAECIGKSNADYFAPADAERWWRSEQELVRSGMPTVDRVEHVAHPRGGGNWWSTTKVPMFDRKGQVSGIAGISRDITALKTGEEMLREQYEHTRMILETANDAFIGMDPEGRVTVWNPQAKATFGWTAAEIMGHSFYDTVIAQASSEGKASGAQQFLKAAQNKQLNRSIELLARSRDGREVPVEATVWSVSVGGVRSFNAFVRDISERRRAEEASKKEARLAQLLQSVTVAANRSSNIAHTAQTCLRLICSHIGWPVGHVYLWANNASEEAVSAGFWHLAEAGSFTTFREASDRYGFSLGTGLPGSVLAPREAEWIVNIADKELQSERTRAATEAGLRSAFAFPVLVEQNIIAVLEFFSPRTVQPDREFLIMMGHIGTQLAQVVKRQRAEEDLQRAKMLAESANRAKSEFLTTMSHEMRTPMNAILGMADLLSESSLIEEQRDYVEIFQKAGANLLHLIDDILDLSRVESGHLELESIGFDLRALLEKIIEMMALRAKDCGLRLVLDVMPGVPSGLVGDSSRLRQIIINLVGNALKFTERGSVTLHVEPDPGGAAGWLRFDVIDTGIGIAADKTEVIFDRFTQGDSSTTRKYGGTGLGLAISKGLVELMGGRIGCSSEIGKGSNFFLSVPFEIRKDQGSTDDNEPAATAIPAAVPAGPQLAARILIVEDSEFNLILVKAYLKHSGYDLDFAENGKIAVEKTMLWNPHLVLMDLLMPVMDGLEATRVIRQWETETHATRRPIIALTAHATGEGAGGSLEAGCNEHLTKPIKKATLLEAISRHLGGRIRIPPSKPIAPPSDASHTIDLAQLIAQMDGDASLFRKMASLFLAEAPKKMEGIRDAVESGNAGSLLKLSHALKGSAANFFAGATVAALLRLESMARKADLVQAPSAYRDLAIQIDKLEHELTYLVDSDCISGFVNAGERLLN
jgi:two-component system sensor histidine kinase/response regulator